MNVRNLALAVALVSAPFGGILAGPAAADPDNHRGEVFSVACDDLGTIEIATNGHGNWTPALRTDNNQVLVPYRFHFEFTPTGGTLQIYDAAKPAPRNGRLDRCTFSGSDPDGTFSGIAWVSFTPSKG